MSYIFAEPLQEFVSKTPKYLCVVPGCSSNIQASSTCVFHSFPDEPDLLQLWAQAIRIPLSQATKWNARVCSEHFDDNVIRGRKVLKQSLPTRNLGYTSTNVVTRSLPENPLDEELMEPPLKIAKTTNEHIFISTPSNEDDANTPAVAENDFLEILPESNFVDPQPVKPVVRTYERKRKTKKAISATTITTATKATNTPCYNQLAEQIQQNTISTSMTNVDMMKSQQTQTEPSICACDCEEEYADIVKTHVQMQHVAMEKFQRLKNKLKARKHEIELLRKKVDNAVTAACVQASNQQRLGQLEKQLASAQFELQQILNNASSARANSCELNDA